MCRSTGYPAVKTGAKVADDYADFYDGDWDDEANPSDGYGRAVAISSDNQPWTGSANDGTELMEGGVSRALSQPLVGIGGLNSSTAGVGPLAGGTAANTEERPALWAVAGLPDSRLVPVGEQPCSFG